MKFDFLGKLQIHLSFFFFKNSLTQNPSNSNSKGVILFGKQKIKIEF